MWGIEQNLSCHSLKILVPAIAVKSHLCIHVLKLVCQDTSVTPNGFGSYVLKCYLGRKLIWFWIVLSLSVLENSIMFTCFCFRCHCLFPYPVHPGFNQGKGDSLHPPCAKITVTGYSEPVNGFYGTPWKIPIKTCIWPEMICLWVKLD